MFTVTTDAGAELTIDLSGLEGDEQILDWLVADMMVNHGCDLPTALESLGIDVDDTGE